MTSPYVRWTSRAPALGRTGLTVLSKFSTRLTYIRLCHMAHKEVLGAVRCEPLRGCRPSFCPVLVNAHHKLDTLAAESSLYCCLCGVSGPRAIGKEPMLIILEILCLTLVRLSLHSLESFAIPHSLHLHTRAALLPHTAKTSPSIATMTPGSIGTPPTDIGPFGIHTERISSDLTGVHICHGVKFMLFSLKTIEGKGLRWTAQPVI